MLRKIQAVLLGWFVAARIIRNNPGRIMVYTLEKVGDQCYELSYINAFKKQHALANVSVLTTNPDHPLLKIYREDFDDIIRISRWEYSILFEFYKLDIGQVFRTRHPQIFSTYLTTYIRNDLLRNNLYLNNAQIVKAIYRIPQDTPPSGIWRRRQRRHHAGGSAADNGDCGNGVRLAAWFRGFPAGPAFLLSLSFFRCPVHGNLQIILQ